MTTPTRIDFTKPRPAQIGDKYRDSAAISYSSLKWMLDSPLRFITEWNRTEPKESVGIQNAVHCRILEPHEYPKRYACFDKEQRPDLSKNMSSLENKAWKESLQLEGKTLLEVDDRDKVEQIARNFANDPDCQCLMDWVQTEVSTHWECPITGLPMKGKIDILGPDYGADLKGYGGYFDKAIDPDNLDLQAFMYCYAFGLEKWYWIPFDPGKAGIGAVEVVDGTAWIEMGEKKYNWAIAQVVKYNDLGFWPHRHSKGVRHSVPSDWQMERYEKMYL